MQPNDDLRCCLLFQGSDPHPAHTARLQGMDVDYYQFETGQPPGTPDQALSNSLRQKYNIIKTSVSIPSEYDVIISAGTLPLETLLLYKLFNNRRASCLYLIADSAFLLYQPIRWKVLGPLMGELLDGCISDSEMIYDSIVPIFGDVPHEVVAPPVPDEHYKYLHNIRITQPNKKVRILSVGRPDPEKNHILLVNSAELLDESIPNEVEVTIIGSGHQHQDYADHELVKTPGYVPQSEIAQYFKEANLYVQPSIGESFGIAAVEGMLSGTPTIVTEGVGMKSLLPKTHVVKPQIDSLQSKLREFVQLNQGERIEIGHQHRSVAIQFTEDRQATACRNAIKSLISH